MVEPRENGSALAFNRPSNMSLPSSEHRRRGVGTSPIWFLQSGGLPLDAIGAQLAAVRILGRPKCFFDHDAVMFDETRRRNVRTFSAYVDSLTANGEMPFSAFLSTEDLTWLDSEPKLAPWLQPPARFVYLAYRSPILQAIALLEDEGPLTGANPSPISRIADTLILLEEHNAGAKSWLRERTEDANELFVEDLASPGVAPLRHMLDDWSTALPDDARIRPIDPPSKERLALADSLHGQLAAKHWDYVAPSKPSHWRRRYTTKLP